MATFRAIIGLAWMMTVIVLPMVVLWYGTAAFGWGFNHRPILTWCVAALLVVLLLMAALSYHHLFPHCSVGILGQVWCRQN
jgi:hypothetical protein